MTGVSRINPYFVESGKNKRILLKRQVVLSKQLARLMSQSLFLDVTQRRLVVTDVSGQLIVPTSKGQAVGNLLLKMRPNDRPKTSVTTNLRFETSQKSENLIYTAAEV
jgi:hypothetical protein